MSLWRLKQLLKKEGVDIYPLEKVAFMGASVTLCEGFAKFQLSFKDRKGKTRYITDLIPWVIESTQDDKSCLKRDGQHFILILGHQDLETVRKSAKLYRGLATGEKHTERSIWPDHLILDS